MKRTLKALICAFLLFVTVLPLAACGNNDTQKQVDVLQEKLERQQEQLQQLQKKNEELERKYSTLIEDIKRLENSMPYTIKVAASNGSVWNKTAASYIIYTQEQLQKFFEDADTGFEIDWLLIADDGTAINKEYFNKIAENFDSKAVVVSVFLSPCTPAEVIRHYLWKDGNKLNVEIDYSHGEATTVETVMIIMEVDRRYVSDVNEAVLALN